MNLSNFKIIKNRANPNLCYSYEKYNEDKTEKYSIFTMDYGKTFLASVMHPNFRGFCINTVYSETFNSKEEALNGIINFVSISGSQNGL